MTMKEKKKVALVAHDNMKRDLAEWVDWNWEILPGTTWFVPERRVRW